MSYEAVFIDWHGTLSDSLFWERWRDDPARTERFAAIERALHETAAGKTLLHSWMTGFSARGDVLGYLENTTGIPKRVLDDELRHSAEHMTYIDDNVLPTIQRLRDIGKQVVLATDNMDTFDMWTVPSLGLHERFDDILNSSKLRVVKSDISSLYGRSQFFYRYLKDMGIAPEDSVLIDDSEGSRCLESTGMAFRHVTAERPLAYHLDEILRASEG